MSEPTVADTRRLNSKPQDLTDAYGPPSNFLEIDVYDPQTIGVGRNRFTTYEVRMRTNLPIFKLKDSCVRRRYSDFEWLKNELERDSKIVVPPLPGKALKRQLPFRGDEGIFEESFIEERRLGLEQFINRCLWTQARAVSPVTQHYPALQPSRVTQPRSRGASHMLRSRGKVCSGGTDQKQPAVPTCPDTDATSSHSTCFYFCLSLSLSFCFTVTL
ncbi:sorting nexin-12 isoform X1 [Osmerus eperlanus]|uniref:sorting nexin-12 isoform X1 n=1 Tax=Osmerus eperlanus TaxID=29151 RepID=UPI002E10D0B4